MIFNSTIPLYDTWASLGAMHDAFETWLTFLEKNVSYVSCYLLDATGDQKPCAFLSCLDLEVMDVGLKFVALMLLQPTRLKIGKT